MFPLFHKLHSTQRTVCVRALLCWRNGRPSILKCLSALHTSQFVVTGTPGKLEHLSEEIWVQLSICQEKKPPPPFTVSHVLSCGPFLCGGGPGRELPQPFPRAAGQDLVLSWPDNAAQRIQHIPLLMPSVNNSSTYCSQFIVTPLSWGDLGLDEVTGIVHVALCQMYVYFDVKFVFPSWKSFSVVGKYIVLLDVNLAMCCTYRIRAKVTSPLNLWWPSSK